MQRTGESDAGRPGAWLRIVKAAAIVLACGLAASSAGAQQPGTPGEPGAGAAAPPAGRTRPPAPPAPALHPNLPAATKAAQLELHAGDLLRAGYPLEGARAYEQAAGFTPKESNLWGSAGWAYLDAGQAAAALAAFRKEQALLPPSSRPPGGLLVANYALPNKAELTRLLPEFAAPEEIEEARKVVSEGAAAKPFSTKWHYGLGYIYARLLDLSPRGIYFLDEVIEAEPENAAAWLMLADLHQAAGNQQQGDAAATRYLELAKEAPDAYRLRAGRYLALRRVADAVAEYRDGLAKHPDAYSLYYGLARSLDAAGDGPGAVKAYQQLIDRATESKQPEIASGATLQLAGFYARKGRYKEAEALYAAAAKLAGAGPAIWRSWAWTLALQGRPAEAAAALQGALERERKAAPASAASPESQAAAAGEAAVALLAAGKREEAIPLLRRAAAPGLPRGVAHAEYAALLAWASRAASLPEGLEYQRGDELWSTFLWRQAPEPGAEATRPQRFSLTQAGWKALLESIVKADAKAWPALYALARLDAREARTAQALDRLKKAAALRPDWWASHYALADRYVRLEEEPAAVAALRRVLTLAPECRQAEVRLNLLGAGRGAPR